ncbi:MAG TPA: TIR domain-containing protein [Pseudonocardiaceae bacterium]|nr:TIR domain-containing protein [Pseudonocardiaceae bacterium]
MDDYDFDIAVSFASPDRRLVHDVVQRLKSAGVTVFYDEDHTATLWGEDLVDLLHSIYSRRARYTMLFVSRHYVQSTWATHERRSAQERAIGQSSPYLLPIRLDDTNLPGLPFTVGYVDARRFDAGAIAALTISKLTLAPRPATTPRHVGVPDNHDDVAALLAERPPAWEYLLFAAILRRGFTALEAKHRDHTLGYVPHDQDCLDDERALSLVRTSGLRLDAVVASFNRMLSAQAQQAAFGRPDEPADPDRIVHLGERIVGVYDELLDWASALRVATIENPTLRRLADVTARFGDQPIAALRSFVAECVARIEAMPDQLRRGERVTIELVIMLSVPDEVVAEHAAVLAAYHQDHE